MLPISPCSEKKGKGAPMTERNSPGGHVSYGGAKTLSSSQSKVGISNRVKYVGDGKRHGKRQVSSRKQTKWRFWKMT